MTHQVSVAQVDYACDVVPYSVLETQGALDAYSITTKLFELSHINPPTHRLLFEALPVMQRLASELDQSCHLTVYGQGKQGVLCKVDTPSGMGFAVRAGAELDVLISASGRVLLAFQDDERAFRIKSQLSVDQIRLSRRSTISSQLGSRKRLRIDPERPGPRPLCSEPPDCGRARPRDRRS
jgi:DNA-binding IclR family transcriptional regulator